MKKIIYALLFALVVSVLPVQTADAADWKHVNAGLNAKKAGNCSAAVTHLQKALSISKKASTYRNLAQCYEKLGQFQNAANTYYAEAALHQKMGETQTYLATKQIADNLNSEVELFMEYNKVVTQPLAKYEPASGMYFGAYIEDDPKYSGMSNTNSNKYQQFNSLVGKQHSTFFKYHEYGDAFPTLLAQRIKEAGGALQLAYEPSHGLNAVKDDAYLRQFAADAKASGIPVFIRFASEMNGDWVAWNGNPTLYKEKFQLVAKVLRQNAPNIAMVWSPNSMPAAEIHKYYPGDAAVDWVGMNVYANPFANGNASQKTDQVNPLDYLDTVYNTYPNKPMMIAEFGASHFSRTSNGQNIDQTKFGQAKMRLFYDGLKLKYPRVKSVHWFSVDTLTSKYVNESRRLNNFSLTTNPTILNTYKNIVASPYYLTKVVNGPEVASSNSGTGYLNLNNATVRSNNNLKVSAYVKSYDPYISKVVYTLNGNKIGESTAFPYNVSINAASLKASNKLVATVFDSKGRVATTKTVNFNKAAAVPTVQKGEIRLFLNDKLAYLNGGTSELTVAPFSKQGRTLVPIRFISENLGATVDYNASTKSITIKKGATTLVMTIGSKSATKNGQKITFEAAPITKNGNTFVPLRVVADALNAKINYDAKTNGIHIAQ